MAKNLARRKHQLFKQLFFEELHKYGFMYRNNTFVKVYPGQLAFYVWMHLYRYTVRVNVSAIPFAIKCLDRKEALWAHNIDTLIVASKMGLSYDTIALHDYEHRIEFQRDVFINEMLERIVSVTDMKGLLEYYNYFYNQVLGISWCGINPRLAICLYLGSYEKAKQLLTEQIDIQKENNVRAYANWGCPNSPFYNSSMYADRELKAKQEIVRIKKQIMDLEQGEYDIYKDVICTNISNWDAEMFKSYPEFY